MRPFPRALSRHGIRIFGIYRCTATLNIQIHGTKLQRNIISKHAFCAKIE